MIKQFVGLPIKTFVDLVKNNQKEGMVVVEIGVFDGSTTIGYADIVKQNKGKIYAIDWFKGNISAVGDHKYNESRQTRNIQQFKINLESYLDLIDLKVGQTKDMILQLPDSSVDICFIDADHRYDFVFSDIKLSIPKIKKGGIICGHDFESVDYVNQIKDMSLLNSDVSGNPQRHAGVIQAVYDHFGYEVQCLKDSIWFKQL